jgi:muconolactone delta-isomerase
MEFLVHIELFGVPLGDQGQQLFDHEKERSKELAAAGILKRLWRVPGRRANWGIWHASSIDELHDAFASLPLYPYMTITVHPLAKHPNDPRLPLT